MQGNVLADLAPKGKRMAVMFRYDRDDVRSIKEVPGSRFTPADKGGPFWTVPLDLETGRELRRRFGQRLQLAKPLIEWGNLLRREYETLSALAVADDAELELLPSLLPRLAKALRPQQRAGVKYGAISKHPLFGDAPRVGKTLQAIGSIYEAGLGHGPKLVVAPMTALDTVWEKELHIWQDEPVLVAIGSKAERNRVIEKARVLAASGKPFWLVVNFAMVAYRSMFVECQNHMADEPVKVKRACEDCEEFKIAEFPFLHETEWNACVIDEGSKEGIRNPNSATGEGLADIKALKKMGLNGTPMGGKHINLWGILHLLRPDIFTSKWNWAGQWLTVSDNGYGKTIGELRSEKEEAFFQSLVPFMISRERIGVPETEDVELEVHMTPGEAKQYQKFAADAEIRIEEEELSATSILAEYTRLKQFASAKQRIEMESRLVGGRHQTVPILHPLPDSGKLDKLMELLDERGILDGSKEHPVVIFSQFKEMVDMVFDILAKKKIAVEKITGDVTKKGARRAIVESFQAGELAVLIMTTTSGGTAITLDRADACIFLDRTWDPDDQYQAKKRIDPVTRMVPKTAYFLLSLDTIEEYVRDINMDKHRLNRALLTGIRLR